MGHDSFSWSITGRWRTIEHVLLKMQLKSIIAKGFWFSILLNFFKFSSNMNKFSLSIRSTIFRIILSNTREQFFVRCQQTKRWKSYLGIIRTYYNHRLFAIIIVVSNKLLQAITLFVTSTIINFLHHSNRCPVPFFFPLNIIINSWIPSCKEMSKTRLNFPSVNLDGQSQ